MPGFIKSRSDEKKWSKAKKIAGKKDGETKWALANWLYHKKLKETNKETKENLKESNELIETISVKTGIPVNQLEKFWEVSVQKNDIGGNKDDFFWNKVMEDFQKLVDQVDIQEAKYTMDNIKQYQENAHAFINHLIDDNHEEAQKAFEQVVQAKVAGIIDEKKEKFCKEILSKQAEKIQRDSF